MNKYQVISEPDLTPDEFELFRDFIHASGGISLDDYKIDSLRIALLARTTLYKFKNYKQYYYFLKFHPAGAEEFKELLTYLTIGETCFFRNPAHFKVLRNHLLPALIKHKRAHNQKYLNIWSAGCSTGDEPYSLAILLTRALPDYQDWEIDILGTDVSKNALEAAAKGRYKKRSLRLLERSFYQNYFTGDGEEYTLTNEIRKMVKFRYFNLVKEPYPLAQRLRKWDIIFCCNVMIYFRLETVQQVVRNIHDSLDEGGYFFTGYAESLQIIPQPFQVERDEETFYYRKISQPEAAKTEAQTFLVDIDENRSPLFLQSDKKKVLGRSGTDLYNEALELYIKEEYQPALEKIKEYLNVHAGDCRALLLLSRIYLEKEMLTEALAACQDLAGVDPLAAKVFYLLGFIYRQRKDVNNAVENFKKAIYLDRNFGLAHYHLAFIYKDAGENEKALREFTNALHIFEKYSSGEALEFGGGFTPKILIHICQKNIAALKSDEIER